VKYEQMTRPTKLGYKKRQRDLEMLTGSKSENQLGVAKIK